MYLRLVTSLKLVLSLKGLFATVDPMMPILIIIFLLVSLLGNLNKFYLSLEWRKFDGDVGDHWESRDLHLWVFWHGLMLLCILTIMG